MQGFPKSKPLSTLSGRRITVCYMYLLATMLCKQPTIVATLICLLLHRVSILNFHTKQQSQAQSDQCRIPSDGVPICSWEFLGFPLSNESDAHLPEGDYMKFVVQQLNPGALKKVSKQIKGSYIKDWLLEFTEQDTSLVYYLQVSYSLWCESP